MKMHRRTTVGLKLFIAACTLLFLILSNGAYAESEREAVINHTQNATWAYYTNETDFASVSALSRWYISYTGDTSTGSGAEKFSGGAYSLGPITNGNAAWWTVGDKSTNNGHGVAFLNQAKSNITTIQNLDNNPSDTFLDIGSGQLITNSQIHSDRQRLQGKTVPIEWYFFRAPNGRWYIVNAPENGSLTVLRFAEKNGNYDWIPVDVSGLNATFLPFSNGVLTFIGTYSYAESRDFIGWQYVFDPNSTFSSELGTLTANLIAEVGYGDVGENAAKAVSLIKNAWTVNAEANNGDYLAAASNTVKIFSEIFVDIYGGPVAKYSVEIGKLAASFITAYTYGYLYGQIWQIN